MPSFASIGDLLGKLVFDVQKAAGDTYITDHVPLSQRVVTDPEAIKCSILMNSLMGEALIRYVPAYAGTITDSPSTGTDVEVLAPDGKVLQGTGAGAGNGVDLPVPSVLMQIDATTGGFIDLWWKFSDEHTTDWISISGDNYEVKATSSDTTHGALEDELEAAGTLSKDIHVVGGKPLVRLTAPSFYTGVTRPSGIGSPGDADDVTVIKGTHDHPPPPPPPPPKLRRRSSLPR